MTTGLGRSSAERRAQAPDVRLPTRPPGLSEVTGKVLEVVMTELPVRAGAQSARPDWRILGHVPGFPDPAQAAGQHEGHRRYIAARAVFRGAGMACPATAPTGAAEGPRRTM